jgi:hypothetical protein
MLIARGRAEKAGYLREKLRHVIKMDNIRISLLEGQKCSLFDLINGMDYKATDARDKIYACFSVTTPDIKEAIHPNNQKELSVLYYDCARVLLT